VVGQGVRANWQWINDSPNLKFPFRVLPSRLQRLLLRYSTLRPNPWLTTSLHQRAQLQPNGRQILAERHITAVPNCPLHQSSHTTCILLPRNPRKYKNDRATPGLLGLANPAHLSRRAVLPLHLARPPQHPHPPRRPLPDPVPPADRRNRRPAGHQRQRAHWVRRRHPGYRRC
jgi:hypothetical protein